MASLYKRAASPFWWVKWRDPNGKIVRQSTKCRVGVGAELITARKLRAELSVREQSRSTARAGGWEWVPQFLAIRHGNAASPPRQMSAWEHLAAYFEKFGISHPHQLTRQGCFGYQAWRTSEDAGCAVNTAILELRTLSVVMREAVRRGLCSSNPCLDLGIKKVTPVPKPELLDEDIRRIRSAIAAKFRDPRTPHEVAHFLRVSFEIAMAQGCRLGETCIDVWRDVNLDQFEITFHAKGDKFYTTELNPSLVPLILELRAQGRRLAYDYGANQKTMLSLRWHKFLKHIGLPMFCFHSTRVTVISRMERAGAPESVVMRVVGHASTTVHRVYRRFHKPELQSWWPKMSSDEPTPQSSENQGSPPASEGRR